MLKIRKVQFHNHPILADLILDFCSPDGKACDTVILAGENGTGKSTVLNALYQLMSRSEEADVEAEIEFENDNQIEEIEYYRKEVNGRNYIHFRSETKTSRLLISKANEADFPTQAIFSDVDINFHSQPTSTVKSNQLDQDGNSRKSTTSIADEINQLLIDVAAQDDAEISYLVQNNPEKPFANMGYTSRMKRFTEAFNFMFGDLHYSRIENRNNRKMIVFCKNGVEIPIESLSSGEKQIVYRGCFLLRDSNALKNAFVFIDEPEISLHPLWQQKIFSSYHVLLFFRM